jgi:NAD-dependent dihydropyrimidine dehydrogenase PreA subunit
MTYFRVNKDCNGCLACVENCPAAALDFDDRNDGRTLKHNMTKCARCGQCWRVCPQNAIEFQHLLVGQWDNVITLDLINRSSLEVVEQSKIKPKMNPFKI